jgi:hypothetical protein
MLPSGLWKEHEPRFGFPVFGDCVNKVSQAVRLDFCRFSWKKAVKSSLSRLKAGRLPSPDMLIPLLKGGYGAMRVRGVLTSRQGEFLLDFGELGVWSAGQAFEINVNDTMAAHGLPMKDAIFMLIMNLGDHTEALSDINIFSMSYEGNHFYTNYRTGAFARTLNDFSKKKHAGFMSVNPKIIVNETHVSSLLFINHSSAPEYADTVCPTVKLYRSDGESLEQEFGPIQAFGCVERSMEDLFKPQVREFLAPTGGLGTTVSTVKGYTLAGISVLRSRDRRSMSIEHTRPTQSYLINGI